MEKLYQCHDCVRKVGAGELGDFGGLCRSCYMIRHPDHLGKAVAIGHVGTVMVEIPIESLLRLIDDNTVKIENGKILFQETEE